MAAAVVRVPHMLAASCGGRRVLEVDGRTARDALDDAIRRHPLLSTHLFDGSGAVREHVHVFLNEDDIRGELDVPFKAGDELVVLQAMSGGSAPGNMPSRVGW